ncbi:MAG: hypothetical protein ACXWP5_11550 [Bdellovibrionota bacterium]
MRRIHIAAAFVAGLSCLSLFRGDPADLLSGEDYAQEESDRTDGHALSSALDDENPWESFNKWQCFPADSAEITCATAEYNGPKDVPILTVSYGTHHYEFSMDPEPEPDCAKVSAKWKNLLENQSSFCTYAAFLQYSEDASGTPDKDESVWIINQLKTGKGYWKFENKEDWALNTDAPEAEGTISGQGTAEKEDTSTSTSRHPPARQTRAWTPTVLRPFKPEPAFFRRSDFSLPGSLARNGVRPAGVS